MNKSRNFKKTCIALAVAQAWGMGQVHAATMRVTSGADQVGNGCTFRGAVRAINSRQDGFGCTKQFGSADFGTDDTIEFGALSNIILEDGPIVIEDESENEPSTPVNVSINPEGSRVTIQRSSFNPSDFGIFEITDSTVSFDNVEITGGVTSEYGGGIKSDGSNITLKNSTVSGNSAAGFGGGIYSLSSTTTLNNSTVSGNLATGYGGGGIFNLFSTVILNGSTVSDNSAENTGGGIYSRNGTITLTSSTVSDNSANTYGGGIFNRSSTTTLTSSAVSGNSADFDGGGISNTFGTTILNDSTISDNSAGLNGGGIINNGTTTLNNSTVSGNSAVDYGGGIYNNGTITLTSSTVSDNSVGKYGGGIFNSSGMITLTSSTVSDNSALNLGGGINNTSSGRTTLNNSIVAGNINSAGSGNFSEVTNFINSSMTASNSLFGSSNAGFDPIANPADNNIVVDLNSTNLDSVLLPLTDNGGSTLTHALPANSPAIDAGDNANCPATDQRGEARDSQCDIGAYERQDDTDFFVVPLANGKTVIFGL